MSRTTFVLTSLFALSLLDCTSRKSLEDAASPSHEAHRVSWREISVKAKQIAQTDEPVDVEKLSKSQEDGGFRRHNDSGPIVIFFCDGAGLGITDPFNGRCKDLESQLLEAPFRGAASDAEFAVWIDADGQNEFKVCEPGHRTIHYYRATAVDLKRGWVLDSIKLQDHCGFGYNMDSFEDRREAFRSWLYKIGLKVH
jgi:hypothetical protein